MFPMGGDGLPGGDGAGLVRWLAHSLGSRITHLTPMQGVCAETAGALTSFGALPGIPVSTTHTAAPL